MGVFFEVSVFVYLMVLLFVCLGFFGFKKKIMVVVVLFVFFVCFFVCVFFS